jgi:hypothetical protein
MLEGEYAGYATRILEEWVHFVGKLAAAPAHFIWNDSVRETHCCDAREAMGTNMFIGHQNTAACIRGRIQKYPDCSPGARNANGTALCHWEQLYRYFVRERRGSRAKNAVTMEHFLIASIGILGFDSRRELGIFLFTTASRMALGPTDPASYPVITRGSFPGGKATGGVKPTTHLHLVPKSRMHGAITPLPLYVFMEWCLVKHRDNYVLPPIYTVWV